MRGVVRADVVEEGWAEGVRSSFPSRLFLLSPPSFPPLPLPPSESFPPIHVRWTFQGYCTDVLAHPPNPLSPLPTRPDSLLLRLSPTPFLPSVPSQPQVAAQIEDADAVEDRVDREDLAAVHGEDAVADRCKQLSKPQNQYFVVTVLSLPLVSSLSAVTASKIRQSSEGTDRVIQTQ